MKARKAVIAAMLAIPAAMISASSAHTSASAAEEAPHAAVTVERTAADADGHFQVDVLLDELPEAGLCALDFAIGYDPAAISIDQTELLYDTGAQAVEVLANPDLADTVFTCENKDGELQVRWATALKDPDYWLREERALFRISGTVSSELPAGSKADLVLIPAARKTEDGKATVITPIAAGYLDAEGKIYSCDVSLSNGAVWKPIDETGATMYGDIDLDGKRSVADAVLLHRAIAEDVALSAAAYANADCELDGVLTIADVTLMLQVLCEQREAAALGAR